MITRWLTLLFVLSICSCGTKKSSTGTASSEVVVLDSAQKQQLTVYFSANQISLLQNYLTNYKQIKTAEDLHRVYAQIDSIYDGLADSLSAKQGRDMDSILNLEPINAIVSGIHFAHYEGDAMLINPDLAAFKKIAATTAEKSDDDFIAIMLTTYGKEPYFSFPKWINQTTDYGGISLLGEGLEVNILQRMDSALAQSATFEKELAAVRETIFYDIYSALCYDLEPDKITEELNKIMSTVKLNAEEKEKLSKRIQEFKKPKNGIQTGCADKVCACGG